MKNQAKVSLDLNEVVLAVVREQLRTFSENYPMCYDEVLCDLKQLNADVVREVHDHLLRHGSGALLAKTAQITGVSRTSVYYFLQK